MDVAIEEGCLECRIKLLVYPGDLDPTDITSILRITPTELFRKGDTIGPNSIGRFRTIKNSFWLLCSDQEVKSNLVDEHLDWMLSKLAPVKSAFNKLIKTDGIEIRLCFIWWTKHGGGFVFSKENCDKISELGLGLEFDIRAFPD